MKKILMIGPFPDPISGVSVSNKVVKNILKKQSEVSIINTSFPIFSDSIGSFSFKKLFFFLKLNVFCYKVFKSDIIYTTPGQTFFGILKYTTFILLASLLKKELIIHVHGNYLGLQYKQLKGFKKKLFKFLISKFTKGIVLSSSLKSNLLPFIDESKITVVHNFAEEYLYQNMHEKSFDSIKIVFLSNLMEEKGIFNLLEALKQLEAENIQYEAKIAGNIDGSLEYKILSKINELKNTQYVGIVSGEDKKQLLQWSTIFILPTFYKMEGQPISILEALATENLIITTNFAGIPDILKEGINGFFVDAENSNDIVMRLLEIDKNKSIIKQIATNNKNYFLDNFTVYKFSEEILKVFYANSTT
ncbi:MULTISPECIES: glycosyltransferase family 4 protein [Polaribacter]|uniref:Glycosyl transferase family 1 domain-containing protein n=1 Tax=Polaribacter gangjinensis TaxID=574710 RepID=A0A2S7WCU8_9FLAO|nr:glycosyltransferase family 4 protein [Polaribacter gangjinensis]PQJ75236.1 hypothetical protein BTO13_08240 [Polaribacter gangjinensis]